jgi:hypothetical protein
MQEQTNLAATHEFWSTQDTVIAPLKKRPIPGKNCDFRTSSPDAGIAVLRRAFTPGQRL